MAEEILTLREAEETGLLDLESPCYDFLPPCYDDYCKWWDEDEGCLRIKAGKKCRFEQ